MSSMNNEEQNKQAMGAGARETARSLYAETQLKSVVLDSIAALLPFVPRDFTVEVIARPSPDRPGYYSTHVSITPITEMGMAIYPVLKKQLDGELKKHMTLTQVPERMMPNVADRSEQGTGNTQKPAT